MTHATHENTPVCQTCGGDGITGYQPGPHPASEIDVPCPDCDGEER